MHVYSVDIDELAEVAVAHDVSTLPRLLFFKVGHDDDDDDDDDPP